MFIKKKGARAKDMAQKTFRIGSMVTDKSLEHAHTVSTVWGMRIAGVTSFLNTSAKDNFTPRVRNLHPCPPIWLTRKSNFRYSYY